MSISEAEPSGKPTERSRVTLITSVAAVAMNSWVCLDLMTAIAGVLCEKARSPGTKKPACAGGRGLLGGGGSAQLRQPRVEADAEAPGVVVVRAGVEALDLAATLDGVPNGHSGVVRGGEAAAPDGDANPPAVRRRRLREQVHRAATDHIPRRVRHRRVQGRGAVVEPHRIAQLRAH